MWLLNKVVIVQSVTQSRKLSGLNKVVVVCIQNKTAKRLSNPGDELEMFGRLLVHFKKYLPAEQ